MPAKSPRRYIYRMREWSIRDAKARLSELIEAAQEGPQAITKRGRQAVVVLSSKHHACLQRRVELLTRFFADAGFKDVPIKRVKAATRDESEL